MPKFTELTNQNIITMVAELTKQQIQNSDFDTIKALLINKEPMRSVIQDFKNNITLLQKEEERQIIDEWQRSALEVYELRVMSNLTRVEPGILYIKDLGAKGLQYTVKYNNRIITDTINAPELSTFGISVPFPKYNIIKQLKPKLSDILGHVQNNTQLRESIRQHNSFDMLHANFVSYAHTQCYTLLIQSLKDTFNDTNLKYQALQAICELLEQEQNHYKYIKTLARVMANVNMAKKSIFDIYQKLEEPLDQWPILNFLPFYKNHPFIDVRKAQAHECDSARNNWDQMQASLDKHIVIDLCCNAIIEEITPESITEIRRMRTPHILSSNTPNPDLDLMNHSNNEPPLPNIRFFNNKKEENVVSQGPALNL